MIPGTLASAYRALRVAAMVAIACSATQYAYARGGSITLNAGTVIAVRLDEALSSNESNNGDKFTATVKESTGNVDPYGLPPGTRIEGIVRLARPKKDKNPGVLDLTFQRLALPDGRSYDFRGSLIGLDSKSVTRDKKGRITAKQGHRTDRLTFVGYGAGAGFLLGLITDKKNTIRDTALGAGLGYLFGALEKDKSKVNDVRLKEGTEMGVRLDSRLTYALSQ